MTIAKRVAEILLDTESVKVNPDSPYTWASGIKAPVYCDNRRLISYPEFREEIVLGFTKLVNELGDFDYVAGTATAGIPWAAFIAQALNKPMVYVRSKPKEHGAGRQIEGDLRNNSNVVLIEDLVSTGGSSLAAVKALQTEGTANVIGIAAIFTYGFPDMYEKMQEEGIKLSTLSDFSVLIELLNQRGDIAHDQKQEILKFIDNPKNWFDGR